MTWTCRCGVAKDLTKLGGKTVTKLVTPEEKQVRQATLAGAGAAAGVGRRAVQLPALARRACGALPLLLVQVLYGWLGALISMAHGDNWSAGIR